MANSWANSAERVGVDLHLALARTGGRRTALLAALRDAVRTGQLPPGTRLPPYRSLAADLGLARNTVHSVYAELVAEGWLVTRQGSGTSVAPLARPAGLRRTAAHELAAQPTVVHDLGQGQPDPSSFPRAAWLTSARRAVNRAPTSAFGPGDPQGRPELRAALAEYLARARGVRTEPEHIVVCSGFAHALRLLFGGRVLSGPLAVESYGLAFHREILAAARVHTHPLAIDEHGAQIEELDELPNVRTVLLTPAHQFPTGGPLHPDRRIAILDSVRTREGLLLEDDYDGEFRYDRQPVGAIQGLDPEHVVYIGSASKSLSTAVRLGWMVLPPYLVSKVLTVKGQREAWTGVVDQLTLADLITSGAYDRHIRSMRQTYRRRRDQLTTLLATHAPHIEATGIAAGLHAVLRLPAGTEPRTAAAAVQAGIYLDQLTAFRHPAATMPARDGLVVGYAAPPEHAYRSALDALRRILPPIAIGTGSHETTGSEM